MIGTTLGHYKILGKLGSGGMGEVYRALDTKLDRHVAIKILPAALAQDSERLSRFEREAKTAAGLNHPHIVTLYSVERDGDRHYITMELVEGGTLSATIPQDGMTLEKLLDLGISMADAVAAAHRKGITHRDLKPGNIMLNDQGQLKILDFGLAKLQEDPRSFEQQETIADATEDMTGEGQILGTPAYMAPEQAEGKPADGRSDVFAMGIILYEMATGHQPFRRDTLISTITAILRDTPSSITHLNQKLPRHLGRVVKRCLEKDPDRRYQTALDVRNELENLREEIASGETRPPGKAPETTVALRTTHPLTLLGIGVLVLGLGMLAGRMLAPSTDEPPVRRFFIPVENLAAHNTGEANQLALSPAISPDGARIASVQHGTVTIRRLNQPTLRPVEGLPHADLVFWSPDGAQLGVVTPRELWRVDFDSGQAERICETPGSVFDAAWGTDGNIVMIVNEDEVYNVSVGGGDPVRIADHRTDGVESYSGVSVPQDGRGFVLIARTRNGTLIHLRDGNRRVELLRIRSARHFIARPRYVRPGYLLYSRFGSNAGLWALPVERGASAPAGDPFIVLPGMQMGSASEDGTLVYIDARASSLFEIVWATLDGEVESVHGEAQEHMRDVSASPDGKRVAYVAGVGKERDLWMHDISTGTTTRLTFGGGQERFPVWSPDNTTLFYSVSESGDPRSAAARLFSIEADGGGSPWPLGEGFLPHVSRDGTTLVFSRTDETNGRGIYSRTLDEADQSGRVEQPRVVVNGAANESRPKLSPDGRWLAYVSDETGRREVYITRFPSGEGGWQLSFEGGEDPEWSVDGNAVYFEWSRRLYKVDVVPRGNVLSASQARLVLDGEAHGLHPWWGYHVSVDGARVLTVREVVDDDSEPSQQGFHVVENWLRAFRGNK